MLLTIKLVDGWHYVVVQGRVEKIGYSTEAAAQRRLNAILSGWI